MAREFAKKFYNSKQWQQCRKAFIASKMGICERCGAPNCKQVHHKEELSELNINNPAVTLSWDNLEMLCDVCHGVETNSKYGVLNEGLAFDADGDLVKAPPVKGRGGEICRPYVVLQRTHKPISEGGGISQPSKTHPGR